LTGSFAEWLGKKSKIFWRAKQGHLLLSFDLAGIGNKVKLLSSKRLAGFL